MRNHNNNSVTQRICAKTGLSLRTLAALVDADQSLLSKYELGTRTLPSDALLQLVKLSTQLNALPVIEPPVLTTEEKEYLQQHVQNCRVQITQLKKQLNAVKENYRHATTMLMVLPLLAQNALYTTTKKQRWIEEQQYQAEKKLKANGPLLQRKLEIEIGGLEEVVRMC